MQRIDQPRQLHPPKLGAANPLVHRGQPLRRPQRTRGTETTYYSYDEQDRLTRAGTVDYRYDANGQLTRRQDSADTADDTRYGYDPYGRLDDVQLPDGRRIAYVLDGFGRRVGKRVDGQLTQGFLYSGGLSPVAELNPDGSVKARFVYATRAHVPDYMVKAGVTYRFVTDQLGSPRLVVDAATGEVAQELEYDEFGQVTRDTNPGFQPFGYAGGLYDRDTDLVHFGAREYDPEVGRWTAKDPIGFAGGDSNLYGYVFADPVNLIDPSGLSISDAAAGFLDGLSGGLSTELAGMAFGFDPGCADWGAGFGLGQGAGIVGGLFASGGFGAAGKLGSKGMGAAGKGGSAGTAGAGVGKGGATTATAPGSSSYSGWGGGASAGSGGGNPPIIVGGGPKGGGGPYRETIGDPQQAMDDAHQFGNKLGHAPTQDETAGNTFEGLLDSLGGLS